MTKDKFLWGSATSAYQCEGGWNADDKGISNWDDFCHSEKNNINCVTGDVASDFYHRYEEDIKLLSQGGTKCISIFFGMDTNYSRWKNKCESSRHRFL